jgi:uncharacterized hydrophobic protein (TIGR00271 family)
LDLGGGQFDDLEASGHSATSVLARVVRDPLFWRGMAALAFAAVVLVWPDRSNEVLWRLLGLGVGIYGIALATGLARRRRLPSVRAAGEVILLLAVAGWMIARPDTSFRLLAVLLAAMIALRGVQALFRARTVPGTERVALVAEGVGLIVAAALLIAFPVQLVVFVAVVAALAIALMSAIGIGESLRTGERTQLSALETRASLWTWLLWRPRSAGDRQVLYSKILFEGSDAGARLLRFVALMTFASIIAATGVMADSTAAIIAAMLIAPLMTPLMATALSLFMGWRTRLARAVTIALLGAVIAVAWAALLAAVLPFVVDVATNSQIVSRTNPTVVDLVIALTAGAAGAYALSRPGISASLPGVAVAIALVPPLSVVGIAWQQTEWEVANGALLLFGTNVTAILLMGGLTFVVTGVTPIQRLADSQHRLHTWLAALAVLTAVVVGAVALNGIQFTRDSLDNVADSTAKRSVDTWLDDHREYDVVDVDVDSNDVQVVLIGPDQPPDITLLANSLSDALDRVVTLELRVLLESRATATSGGSS